MSVKSENRPREGILPTSSLACESEHLQKLARKQCIIKRLVKEMMFRKNEQDLMKAQVDEMQSQIYEPHEVRRICSLYEESNATYAVTLKYLERECLNCDEFVCSTFPHEMTTLNIETLPTECETQETKVRSTLKQLVQLLCTVEQFIPDLASQMSFLKLTTQTVLLENEEPEV